MKIAVLGYSGAGKSTLAKKLGEKYECPVLHLDQVQFIENWRLRDREEAIKIVDEFMAKDSWVIDGNYSEFALSRRLADADKILFLNVSRWICLWRVWRRFLKNRGFVRESMAPGCLEKLDAEFIRWVLFDGRSKKRRSRFNQIIRMYPEKVLVLSNKDQRSYFSEINA